MLCVALRHLPGLSCKRLPRVLARAAGGFLLVHAIYWACAVVLLGQPLRPLAALFWPFYTDDLEAALGLEAYFDLWILVIACGASIGSVPVMKNGVP